MTNLRFKLRQLLQRMWFLPAAFSCVAVLTVIIAYLLADQLATTSTLHYFMYKIR